MALRILQLGLGTEDLDSALPQIQNEEDLQFDVDQASTEMKAMEAEMNTASVAMEDASDVLEEMKEVIVQHESNVASMDGEQQPDVAQTESGEVVAEVPAETQPQVDENSTDSEIQEQNAEMNQAVESFAGRLANIRADELYTRIGIGKAGGVEDAFRNPRMAYRAGLEGFKEFAIKVWGKIKMMFQSLMQFLSKWINKALVWLKGYEKKAKSLKEEAGKLKDDAKLDFGKGSYSALTQILFKEKFTKCRLSLALSVLSEVKKDVTGNLDKYVLSGIGTSTSSSSSNDKKEGDKSAGNNDANADANNASEPAAETKQEGGEAAKADVKADVKEETVRMLCDRFYKITSKFDEGIASYVDKGSEGKFSSVVFASTKAVVGMDLDAKGESGGEKLVNSLKLIKKDLKAPENYKEVIQGSAVKTLVNNICDEVIKNAAAPQKILSETSKDVNKIRNEVFKTNAEKAEASNINLISKIVMAYSGFMHKLSVHVAYLPGVYLSVASEALKGAKGGNSDSGDKKEEKQEEKK